MNSFDPKTQVLVVDDSRIARRQLVTQLNEIGISQVMEAVDGLEALDVVRTFLSGGRTFDLIILDLRMPNMTGAALLKEMNADPAMKSIPKIIVSVETDRTIVLDAVMIGAEGYILKPVSNDVLAAKLERVFARKKAA